MRFVMAVISIPILSLYIGSSLLYADYYGAKIAQKVVAIGDRAPVFTLPEFFTNKPVELEQFYGKIVFINFWASWCGPCKDELPLLVAFAKAHPEVKILAINVKEDGRNGNEARRLASQLPPFVVPLHGVDSLISDRYFVRFLPMTFVLNQQGFIHMIIYGAVPNVEALEASLPQTSRSPHLSKVKNLLPAEQNTSKRYISNKLE